MTIRINYDDNELDIIDKISAELEQYGLKLQDDEKEHDGFMILEIVEIEDERRPFDPRDLLHDGTPLEITDPLIRQMGGGFVPSRKKK